MENKWKRLISCLAIILVVAVLFGCKHDSDSSGSSGPGTEQSGLPAPTAVTVAAHESKQNTVTVTWQTGAEPAAYYWIYYSTTNDTAQLTTPQAKLTSSFYVDKGTGSYDIVLGKSGTYWFWVRAADGYGADSAASGFSAAASHQFTFKELPVPTGVAVTAHASTKNTVTVTWQTGAEPAACYWIYYSTTNDTAQLTTPQAREYASSLWNGTGTCDIVLDKSGTYWFWVRAASDYSSEGGASGFSAAASHAFTSQQLAAPNNVRAEKYESASYPGIKLSWDTANAPYYQVYWSESNDPNAAEYLTNPSSTSYTIYESVYDLVKGTTYYFWVKSANGYSSSTTDSGFSTVVSFLYN